MALNNNWLFRFKSVLKIISSFYLYVIIFNKFLDLTPDNLALWVNNSFCTIKKISNGKHLIKKNRCFTIHSALLETIYLSFHFFKVKVV